jgi:hypothetical protein
VGINRPYLGDGMAVDSDDYAFTGLGASYDRRDIIAKFPNTDLLHKRNVARVYTSEFW